MSLRSTLCDSLSAIFTRHPARIAAVGGLALCLSSCVGGSPAAADGVHSGDEPAVAASSSPDTGQSGATRAPGSDGGTTLGLTYIPNIQFAPVYVAEDDGLFTAAGQLTTLRHHGGDEGLFTALMSGEEDVVLASGDEALMARAQGMDLVSVGTYYQRHPVTILVPEASPITDLRGLAGKRIGIPGEYGSSWIGLQAILATVGMSPADVEVVSIGYTQLAALSANEVDAIVGFSNNELVWFGSAGVPVRAVKSDELPLVSASLITTRQALEDRPHAICALVQATEAGMRRTVDTPQRAVESTQQRDQSLSNADSVAGARQVLAATSALFVDAHDQVSARPDTSTWQAMLDFYRTQFGDDAFTHMQLGDVVSERCFQR